MKQILKIQLHVNQTPLGDQEEVSTNFHIFLNDKSFCKKLFQDTQFFETDLCLPHQNLMELPTKKFKTLLKENKAKICKNCYKNCNKWLNELENRDINKIIDMLHK